MVRREPPQTEEGWYALHDLRTVDWAAWQDAPERVRERALEDAVEFLRRSESVADADAGDSAVFTVLGHEADLMIVHLRPSLADLDALERRFQTTEFARFTERSYSYVSVTEASGYTERAREYFEGEVDDDPGLAQYIQSRLHPSIPDHEFVSFYPMEKRRDPDQNWYDLPFEERAEHMASHGDIGRDYAGTVQQMITGSVGMDDWEWGVTLWADDLTDVKSLLYEMRFDPSSSKFAEFGPFFVGRRFAPGDLGAVLAGERVPAADEGAAPNAAARSATSANGQGADGDHGADERAAETAEANASAGDGASAETVSGGGGSASEGSPSGDSAGGSGGPPAAMQQGESAYEPVDAVEDHLATFGLFPDDYAGAGYGLVCYVEADADAVVDDVEGLRGNFDHYDTHVLTSVRADQGQAAVVSLWDNERAADIAAGFLSDLPDVSRQVGGPLDGEGDGDADDEAADHAADESADGESDAGEAEDDEATDARSIRAELAEEGVYAGQPHGEDVYALVLYSRADPGTLFGEVEELRDGFDRYDTHVRTAVYADPDSETAAVVSLWETESAVETAADYLTDLPEIVGRPEDREGFGTMGMFYTVKPDHREAFTEKFETVGELLDEREGHRETALLVNHEDENDMFIASQWDAREDAMAFFRSEAFRDTVEWGREVLADRPRHVFLA